MNRSTRLFKSLLAAAALALPAIAMTGCGDDDPVTPPAPAGNSTINMFSANPGLGTSTPIRFRRAGVDLATVNYGTTKTATIPNGNSTIDIVAADGSGLGSASLSLDSTKRAIVLFSGKVDQKDAYAVTTALTTPQSGNAAVRVVHASQNAGDIGVKVNSVNGLPFTNSLSYKNGTAYLDLPVLSLTQLVITKANDTTELLSIPITPGLGNGKRYAVIVYGSADPAALPDAKLKAEIIEE